MADHDVNINYISDKLFPFIQDLNVIELGPFDGAWFTKPLERYAKSITAIELNPVACNYFRKLFGGGGKINLIEDDFHSSVRSVGVHDAVVLFGVLYHSHSPLGLLEDIVHFVKPTYILIEAHNNNDIVYADEICNSPGQRFSKEKQTSGISLILGMGLYRKALTNLSYTEIFTFNMAENEINNGTFFKKEFSYSVFNIT